MARYTGELSLALARCFPDDEFVLLSDQPFRMPEHAPANLKRGGGPRNAAERRWWIWGLDREMHRLAVDLIHGPDFAVPYIPRRPSVLTLHDLSPWMDPAWHHGAKRVRRRTPLLLDRIATMIVTPGDAVRRQAIDHFRLQPDRVVAVPEAPAPWLRRVPVPPPATPYFLFVGTLEPRKNLQMLVDAWREVRKRHTVDLILAGRKRADAPAIAEEPGLQTDRRSPRREAGGVVLRGVGAGVSVAVRGLRAAGAGGDAMRYGCDRVQRGAGGRGRRCRLCRRCQGALRGNVSSDRATRLDGATQRTLAGAGTAILLGENCPADV
ncbi:MAG: glycosyltransferase [Ignavibacteriota bacterium]